HQMRVVRGQLIGDIVRPLSRAEQVRLLLDNADLISLQVDHVPELAGVDVTEAICDALSLPSAVSLSQLLVEEIEKGGAARVPPWMRAEQRAEVVAADPEAAMRGFDAVADPDAYEREAASMQIVLRALARRGDALAVRAVFTRFMLHAGDARRLPRVQQRATE